MVKRKGFTLTEMMIVVAIIGILFAVGGPILNQANRNYILSRAKLQLQGEARAIMYLITRNLRQAKNSTIILSRNDANQPFYSRITFTKIDNKTYTFYQEGRMLKMTQGAINRTLNRNIKYLAFTFPESSEMDIVSISLTLEKTIFEGRTKALHMASEKVRVMN